MTTPTEPPPAPASEPVETPPLWWTALDYALRVICIVVVVGLTWQAIPIISRFFPGGGAPERKDKDLVAKADPLAVPRILAAGPQPGPWRMAGSEWEFALAQVPAAEVDARLKKVADNATGIPRAVDVTGKDFLEALRVIAPPQDLPGGRHLYRISEFGWKVMVVSQGEGDREAILTGAAAWGSLSGDWQWVELIPRSDQASRDTPQVVAKAENLLPLLPGAAVLASRWSTSGELLLQIVSTPLPFSDFEKEWKGKGYRLHPARGVAPPMATDPIEQRSQAWFAVRGEEVVYVWTTTQGTRSTLLLARTAAEAVGATPGDNPSQPPRESTP